MVHVRWKLGANVLLDEVRTRIPLMDGCLWFCGCGDRADFDRPAGTRADVAHWDLKRNDDVGQTRGREGARYEETTDGLRQPLVHNRARYISTRESRLRQSTFITCPLLSQNPPSSINPFYFRKNQTGKSAEVDFGAPVGQLSP